MPVLTARLPDGRWEALEIAFWLIPIVAFFLLPNYRVLGSQILITALFAVSLDLILGYAGIVSLGHAAFFGIGAYTAGLLAVHGWHEPLSGLLAAALVATVAGYVVSFLVIRGGDLTRLMVTLGIGLMLWEAANKAHSITGGVDGLSGVTRAASACRRLEHPLRGGCGRCSRSPQPWPVSPVRCSRRRRNSSASTRWASRDRPS